MVLTRSYGASSVVILEASIERIDLSNVHFAPRFVKRSIKVRVSRKSGTFLIVVVPSASNAEAIIGKTAFFAPDILTLPLRVLPPLITSLSTCCWAHIIFTIHNLNDRIFTAKKLGDSFNFLLFVKIHSFNISFIFQDFFSYIQIIIS